MTQITNLLQLITQLGRPCYKVVQSFFTTPITEIDLSPQTGWSFAQSVAYQHAWVRDEVLRVQEGQQDWAFCAESEKQVGFSEKERPYFLVFLLVGLKND